MSAAADDGARPGEGEDEDAKHDDEGHDGPWPQRLVVVQAEDEGDGEEDEEEYRDGPWHHVGRKCL